MKAYRRIRRVMMPVALLALLASAFLWGLGAALVVLLAFVVGVTFASLNYLEDEAKREALNDDHDAG